MLGAIVGDIVGSRFEFNNTHRTDFELFAPECGFTDDTVCTVAVADALLRGVDFGPTLHSWCRRYPYPTGGYGGRFRQWVASDDPQPYFSFGNGSGMRVSPCGWVDGPMDDVLEADPDPGVPLAWWHGRYPSRRRAEATPGRGRSPR